MLRLNSKRRAEPRPKQDYPPSWKIWEDEVLAPFLAEHPERIAFTAYQQL